MGKIGKMLEKYSRNSSEGKGKLKAILNRGVILPSKPPEGAGSLEYPEDSRGLYTRNNRNRKAGRHRPDKRWAGRQSSTAATNSMPSTKGATSGGWKLASSGDLLKSARNPR